MNQRRINVRIDISKLTIFIFDDDSPAVLWPTWGEGHCQGDVLAVGEGAGFVGTGVHVQVGDLTMYTVGSCKSPNTRYIANCVIHKDRLLLLINDYYWNFIHIEVYVGVLSELCIL